jgi:hypothetical protein
MTTLELTFNTPMIDAQIAELNTKTGVRRAAQLQQAKEILSATLIAGSIYNVDMQDAKDGFSRAIGDVLDHMHSAYWQANRALNESLDSNTRDEIWAVVDTSLQLNHVAGRIRRAEKLAKKFANVEPFLAVYREALPFAQAVEELKGKVVMGRKPLENPKPLDLSNTGTCAICQRSQKLTAGQTLVHHGFAISDGRGHFLGFRSGRCFGVSRKPYEFSNEANVAFIAVLIDQVATTKKRIASLEAGEIAELGRMETRRERGLNLQEFKVYKVSDDIFPQLLGHELASANNRLAGLKHEIERQKLLLKSWVAKPLPGTAV